MLKVLEEVGPALSSANQLVARVAQRVRRERQLQRWSLDQLATRAGVSRAMISKIERGETQASAVLLCRLADALGVTMTHLIDDESGSPPGVSRVATQAVWVDPASGYVRRRVSPAMYGSEIEIVAIELPAGAEVRFAALRHHPLVDEQVLVLEGTVRLVCDDDAQVLQPGDCAVVRNSCTYAYINPGPHVARYLVVTCQRQAEIQAGPTC